MPLIAVAVGYIGSAVGTAIGTAIGGSILGVSAATIGGVIGAGIAGGILSAATGGSFGRGFLMGAAGSAIGSFLRGGLGETFSGGATQLADGTTSAEMFAAQGGAEFAPDALSGMGDLSAGAAEAGIGDLGFAGTGTETYGLGETAIPEAVDISGTSASSPSWEVGLQDTVNAQSMGFTGGDTSGTDLATSAGFNTSPTVSSNQFATTPGMASESPMLPTDYSYTPLETSASPSTLENVVSNQGGATPGYGGDVVSGGAQPTQATQGGTSSQGGGGGFMQTTDRWLQNNLGMPQGSTGKLLMGGLDAYMKNRQANQLEREVGKTAPMTYEQYAQRFGNPEDYRRASAELARSGRTGTLPVLLARMNERLRSGYAGYLPGAQQQYLNNRAGVMANRTSALNNLFTPYAQNAAMVRGTR